MFMSAQFKEELYEIYDLKPFVIGSLCLGAALCCNEEGGWG